MVTLIQKKWIQKTTLLRKKNLESIIQRKLLIRVIDHQLNSNPKSLDSLEKSNLFKKYKKLCIIT